MRRRIVKVTSRFKNSLSYPVECHWCSIELNRVSVTVDHLIPKSKGGRDAPSNMVPACLACNNLRGNAMPHEADVVALELDRRRNFVMLEKEEGRRRKRQLLQEAPMPVLTTRVIDDETARVLTWAVESKEL